MNHLPEDVEARLEALAGALREGELSDSEQAELRELLRSRPGARAYLAEHLQFVALLKEELATEARSADVPARPRRTALRRVLLWASAGVAAAAALVIGIWRWAPVQKADTNVAVLGETINAVWRHTSSLQTGSPLPPGRVALESGAARIGFKGGADVVLDGRTELEIVSEGKCFLHNGRLRAVVPPKARGFVVGTSNAEVTDYGTEFGVEVAADAPSQIHVFSGRVQVADPKEKSATRELRGGMALAITADGHVREMQADPQKFLGFEALRMRAAKPNSRFAEWQKHSQSLCTDPRLVAYYPFVEQREGYARLSSVVNESTNGSIDGCRRVTGRWPEKKALDFKRPTDRVRVNIPGEFASMTLAAWVSVDGLDNQFNALLMSDGWYVPGQLHWQIRKNGELELGVWVRPEKDTTSTSREIITADKYGRWMHLAVVYDHAQKTVTHYVDGRSVGTTTLTETVALHAGAMQIGSWESDVLDGKAGVPVRSFNGQIDELAIWGAALSEQDIRALYESGKP